jgi:hypothetical protein
MQTLDKWSIPEGHMARYHVERAAILSVVAMAVLAAVSATLAILGAVGSLAACDAGSGIWYVAFVVTPVVAASSFIVKERLLGRVADSWTPYEVVSHYRKSVALADVTCVVAGLLACFAALHTGEAGLRLLIVLAPLGVMAAHHPKIDALDAIADDLAHRP